MPLVREDWFVGHYNFYIRRLLTIVGLWPYEKRSRRLPSIIFITTVMIIGINGQIYIVALLIYERKAILINEVMQTLLPSILFSTAYWNLLCNPTLIKQIFERISHDWSKLLTEDELSIMETYAAQSKVASHSVTGSFFLYAVFLIFPSFLFLVLYISGIIDNSKLTLPVYHEILMTSTFRYCCSFSLQLTAISTGYILGITHYILFIIFLQHACGLFIIVTNDIEKSSKENNDKFGWALTDLQSEAQLSWIVIVAKNYNNAINFVELIRSLYGKMYILEVLMFFGAIVVNFISFFKLFRLMVTPMEALKMCLYINGSMLMIYAYFYLGEKLMEHSSNVCATCRLVPFYTLSDQTNKLLLLLIMRSTKPCKFSVSGIAVASHEFFAKIMKVSFSFATVFFNVR